MSFTGSDGHGADGALQRAETGMDVRLDERKMYVAEWADGTAFGFTVTPVQSDRGTVLCLSRRTTPRASLSSAGLEDVVPGDMLVAIGDEKVYHLGASNATKYLRSVQKPVRLTLQLSPYGDSAKDLPDLAPNEYTYLWESGPLGIVLTTDPKSKLPVMKRFTGKADSPQLERDVSVGDELVYVNQTATSDHSIPAIIGIIKDMPKPITLRFRRPLADELEVELPELGEGEYDFLWEYGSLGLVVGTSADGLPFVRSFTGKGTSRQLAMVQENDQIVLVNNKPAKESGFHEIMQYIMNVPKPAVIRFRRPLSNRNSKTMPKPPLPAPAPAPAPHVESASPPTAQMGAMNMGAASPTRPPPSPQRSNSARSSSRSTGNISRSASTSVASETESAPGLLGYRTNRSNSSFTMNRHQRQFQAQHQPLPRSEDLSFNDSDTPQQPQYHQPPPHQYQQQQQYQQPSPQQQQQYQYQQQYQQTPPPQQQQQYQYQQQYQQTPPPQQTPQTPPQAYEDEEFYEVDMNAFYQIQWTDGPFGFTVREARCKQGAVMLITKRTGKSTCAGLRRVAVGDILVKIGEKDVRQMGFERGTMHLRNVPKPVVLTFQAVD